MAIFVRGQRVKNYQTVEGDGFVLGTTQPDATNTGVGKNGRTSRSSLTVINGDFTVPSDNYVLNDKYVKGRMLIGAHKGLVATNCVFEPTLAAANGYSTETRIVNADTSTGMNTFNFCEFTQPSGNGAMNGPGNKNLTLFRCDISRGVDNVRVNMGGGGTQLGSGYYFIMEGCYLHDQLLKTPDPLQFRSDYKTHSDGIQFEGNPAGSLIRVYGNAIHAYHTTDGTSNVDYVITVSGQSIPSDSTGHGVDGSTGTAKPYPITLSCVMITPSGGHTISDFQLEKNWFFGGNNSVNSPQNAGGTSVLKDNRFAPYYDTAGGRISPPTWTGGMVKSGNTNMSDGSAV